MSTPVQTVRVELSQRGYDIQVGTGNLAGAGRFVAGLADVSHVVLITDTNVDELYADAIGNRLREADISVDLIDVEPGETSKSVDVLDEIWETMLEVGTDRKSIVVAVGGGVVGDLAGFAAASYARGIPFVQIPTTLLAQVDSSVGGKVGINLPGAKNMVGAFWQPLGVLIDTEVLTTLPDREYRAGLAEVVKYGVILDPEFFEYLEQNVEAINAKSSDVLRKIVVRCCQLKAEVVTQDEREETGQRAVLNYGHTFCHAFEAVAGYGELLHGEAVAIGMICASRLAESLGRIPAVVTQRQQSLLAALGLSTAVPAADIDQLLDAMMRDKKVEHGELRFVLPSRMGHVELVSGVESEQVEAVLRVK